MKKNLLKITSLFLAVLMLVSSVPMNAFAEESKIDLLVGTEDFENDLIDEPEEAADNLSDEPEKVEDDSLGDSEKAGDDLLGESEESESDSESELEESEKNESDSESELEDDDANKVSDAEEICETIDGSDYVLQSGGLLSEEMNYSLDEDFITTSSYDVNSTNAKAAASAIRTAFDNIASECNVSKYNIPSADAGAFYFSVVNTSPRYFYVKNSVSWYTNSTTNTVTKYCISYSYDKSNISAMKSAYEATVEAILSGVNLNWTDMEKAVYLHDYIVDNCEYDLTYSNYDAYNVFVDRTAVCQGYALAYKDLLDRVGIECQLVTSDSVNHAWNLIKINSKYYYVDATWDDPTKDLIGRVLHTQFLKSYSYYANPSVEGVGSHLRTMDWQITGGCTYNCATDTSYDVSFFNDVSAGFRYIGGTWYAKEDKSINKYVYKSATWTKTGCLYTISDVWRVYDKPNSYWIGAYSGLGTYNGLLYINSPTAIYSLNPANGNSRSLVYELTSSQQSTGHIYGMYVDSAGNVICELTKTPNTDVSGTTVYTIKKVVKSITITFDYQDDEETTTSKKVNEGDKIGELPDLECEGYDFEGWYTSATGGTKVTEDTVVTSDITLYARWSIKQYTVSFVPGNGTTIASIKVDYGDEIGTLPTPKKTGYDFDGWYTASTGGTKVTEDTIVYSDITLYAVWTIKEYTISFVPDNGTTIDSIKVNHGDAIGTLPTPEKEGYDFAGWYTAASGGTKVTSNTVATSDAKLYARWSTKQYTVKFVPGNGTTIASIKVNYGDAIGTLPIPKKTGYDFDGWYTATTEGTKVTEDTIVYSDISLYAVWTIKEYTISFVPDNGTTIDSIKVSHGDAIGTLPTPEKEGYDFAGWYTSTSGGTKVTSDTVATSDAKLYARWSTKQFTVSFVPDNGGTISPVKVDYKTAIGSLPTPKKTGYDLVGWYTAATEGTEVTKDTIVSSDMTLYAVWSPKTFTVSFDTGYGIEVTPIQVTYASTYGQLPVPAIEGREFAGWFTAAIGGDEITADTIVNITDNQTLYAHSVGSYKVPNPAITIDYDDSENPGQVNKGTRLFISCIENGATIYYTVDGSNPDKSSVNNDVKTGTHLYEDAITIDENITIKAIAVKEGYKDSEIVCKSYILRDESADWGDITNEDDRESLFQNDANNVPKTIWVSGIEASYTYTGKAITEPELRVYYYKTLLTLNKDYIVRYTNNINVWNGVNSAKAPTIIIIGKGNYAGTISRSINIIPVSLSNAKANGLVEAADITLAYKANKVQKGTTKVTYKQNGTVITLKNGTDYRLSYALDGEPVEKPMAAGEYIVTVLGNGNYADSITFKQTISDNALMSAVTVKAIPAQPYTGNSIEPALTVTYKGETLQAGVDYEIENHAPYIDICANAGVKAYALTLVGKGNEGTGKYKFDGTKTVSFTISGNALKNAKFDSSLTENHGWANKEFRNVRANSVTFRNKSGTFDILNGIERKEYDKLSDDEKRSGNYAFYYEYVCEKLAKDSEDYKTLKDVGTVKIIFTGVNAFTGTVTKSYKITGLPLSGAKAEHFVSTYTFTPDYAAQGSDGCTIGVRFVNKANGKLLTEGTDYVVTYSKNTSAGTATMIATGINSYTGAVKKTFTIAPYDISPAKDAAGRITVANADQLVAYYSKAGATLALDQILVKDGNTELQYGVDYTVRYSNNTKVSSGNASKAPTLTIVGKGNYKGTKSVTFTIVSKPISEVSKTVADLVYKDKAGLCKTAAIKLMDGKALVAGTDYKTITYRYASDCRVREVIGKNTTRDVDRVENEKVGDNDIIPVGAVIEAIITAKGEGYTGATSVRFRIIEANVSSAAVKINSQYFAGAPVTLSKDDIKITMKVNGQNITLNKTDYEIVSYSKNTTKGTATVTIKGVGNYGGTKTCNFTILAKPMKN